MKREAAVWTGVFTGPIVWLLAFEAKFALAPWVCAFQWKAAAVGVSLLSLAATAGAGFFSRVEMRKSEGQVRTIAAAGTIISASFFIVLLAQFLPELMLGGCE